MGFSILIFICQPSVPEKSSLGLGLKPLMMALDRWSPRASRVSKDDFSIACIGQHVEGAGIAIDLDIDIERLDHTLTTRLSSSQ